MPKTFYRLRAPLARFRDAMARGAATVGFLGGSITDQKLRCMWPDKLAARWAAQYPNARLHFENAAVGGTGSEGAIVRARREIIERGCALVFVECDVNDDYTPACIPEALRPPMREGLIRILRAACDVVIVHSFCRGMLADYEAGRAPRAVTAYERLAEAYGASSVFAGEYALSQMREGVLTFSEWLPDGCHPGHLGSELYARPALALLRAALADDRPAKLRAVAPLDPDNWEGLYHLPLSCARTEGCWYTERPLYLPAVERVLCTFMPGAQMAFDFEGTGFLLTLDEGRDAADFRWAVDDGGWQPFEPERDANLPPFGWRRTLLIAHSLPRGRHTARLVAGGTPEALARRPGTAFRLAEIGIVP